MKKLMMALLAGCMFVTFGAQAADKDMKKDAPKAEKKAEPKGEGKKRAPKAAKG